MTLAVVRTLSTNKQSNKQKETKRTRFQHDVLLNNKYGNGFWVNLIEWEAPKRVPGIRKKETRHCRIRRHQNQSNKDQKLIPARNSHNKCFESNYLCIYVRK